MISEIPQYALRAYALFYTKFQTNHDFKQSELDWIVKASMRKKIFSILLNSGWIKKVNRFSYRCINPDEVMKGLLQFKLPELIKEAKKPYAFTKLSAIEIWSDFVYVQRGIERSPYFIKINKKDINYWKEFFNERNIPNYMDEGTTIGEFVILLPVEKVNYIIKDGLKVETLSTTFKIAKKNELYNYPYNYMRKKYAAG